MDEEPLFVVVVNTEPRQVVYHQYGRVKAEDDDDTRTWKGYTKCGKLWIDGSRWAMFVAHIRRDHAEMIGRPCRVCFPCKET